MLQYNHGVALLGYHSLDDISIDKEYFVGMAASGD
jgi:hypothetical protein